MKNTKLKLLNYIKSFTPYQFCYLTAVLTLTILFCVFFPDDIMEDTTNTLAIICSICAVIANPICELLISKQSKWNFIVSIVFIEVTESILCFSLGYYSTAIISLVFWIPIDLLSFINWNKHLDEEKVELTKVKKLNWWQDVLIILGIFAFGFGVGYFLKLIPGAEDTYMDSFCSAVGMCNGILLYFRYNEQWYAWFICLILEATLYITSGTYIMLIAIGTMFINTIYGFVKWLIYIKIKKRIYFFTQEAH